MSYDSIPNYLGHQYTYAANGLKIVLNLEVVSILKVQFQVVQTTRTRFPELFHYSGDLSPSNWTKVTWSYSYSDNSIQVSSKVHDSNNIPDSYSGVLAENHTFSD